MYRQQSGRECARERLPRAVGNRHCDVRSPTSGQRLQSHQSVLGVIENLHRLDHHFIDRSADFSRGLTGDLSSGDSLANRFPFNQLTEDRVLEV